MKILADLHVHSRYSAAVSPDMSLETLIRWAGVKGIDLLATGDFTHPEYFKELSEGLEPAEPGLLKPRGQAGGLRFLLSVEASNVFYVRGRRRRVHTLVMVPSLDHAAKLNGALALKTDLSKDGRPVFEFHVKDLVKIILDISPEAMLVPAHAWTPWFSVFGSESGFDSLEECFEDQTPNITAVETGMCTDPPMNRKVGMLQGVSLISNSDAHSPGRIGREANCFDCALDYDAIRETIRTSDPAHFLYTIELFPAHGKYYWDGHRNCGVGLNPAATREHDFICPKCSRRLTVGALHRVESLSGNEPELGAKRLIPCRHLVPLEEIIAVVLQKGPKTKSVQDLYWKMIRELGAEIPILSEMPRKTIAASAGEGVAEAVLRARAGEISLEPGYDGLYGTPYFPAGVCGGAAHSGVLAAGPKQGELF